MVFIQVASDKHGAVFGGLMNAPLQPTPKKKHKVKPFACLQIDFFCVISCKGSLSYSVLSKQVVVTL
jgi:hypothetical protein